jgi:hypothetical protein
MLDPFQLTLTDDVVGAKAGVTVSINYELVAIDPDGASHLLLGPVTESTSFGGGHGQTTYGYFPHQNGEFRFRVVRLDGSAQTVLVERRAATDKGQIIRPVAPPNTRPDGRLEVTALQLEPAQPVVGQQVTIEVEATNFSPDAQTETFPVLFVDDTGQQTLSTGTFSLAPGTSGSGLVSWIPQAATSGTLEAGGQRMPVTIAGGPTNTDAQASVDAPPPADAPDVGADDN